MAYHLQQLSRKGKRIFFVGGLYHLPGLFEMLTQSQTEVIGRRYRKGVGLAHLHRDSSREIMSEMPFLAAKYEKSRSGKDEGTLDRLEANNQLIRISRQNYWKNSKEELSPSQVRVLNRFARNYALVPGFYQLIVAARGAADDNFAYEVWDNGSDYPWQTDNPGLPVLRLSGEDLFLDQKRIKFHRRLKTFRRRLVPVPIKKKKRERIPGEWKKDFQGLFMNESPENGRKTFKGSLSAPIRRRMWSSKDMASISRKRPWKSSPRRTAESSLSPPPWRMAWTLDRRSGNGPLAPSMWKRAGP
jgi:hypothetical protein